MVTQEEKYRWLGLGDPSNVALSGNRFTLSNLTVTVDDKPLVPLFKVINVEVNITNSSANTTYSTNVTLRANGAKKDTKSITLTSGSSTTVSLSTGLLFKSTYDIQVDSANSSDTLTDTVTL
jgi:hypothetical protein